MSKIKSIDEQVGQYISIGIHGEPGMGKTAILGTKSSSDRMLIIDECAGLDTLKSKLFEVKPSNIDSVEVEDIDELIKLFGWLVKNKQQDYDWIAIDCMTSLAKKFFNNSQESGGRDGRQHYGNAQADCLRTIGMMTNKTKFPFNTIITFHTTDFDDGERVVKKPHLVGQALDSDVGGVFDICAYLKLDIIQTEKGLKSRRALYCQPDQLHYGKDRSDNIPIPCRPNLEFIVNKYREGLGLLKEVAG